MAEEVSAYEALRHRALGAEAQKSESYGWALLVSQGVVAWLRAFSSYVPKESLRQSGPSVASAEVPTGLKRELTEILTNMVLQVGS